MSTSTTGTIAPPRAEPLSEHLRILSRPDWVEPVVLFLKERATAGRVCDESAANRLVVAMTEAITNAIVHGNYELSSDLKQKGDGSFKAALDERKADPNFNSRIVDVRVDYAADRCTWTITDQGPGFNTEKALKRLESEDPMEILASGRGISIMRAFVDEVAWSEGGRQIHLTIHLDRGSEKRQHERRRYTATIGLILDGQSQMHSAMARDLSAGGIAFVTDQPFDLGSAATVLLDASDENSPRMHGRIVRCRHVSGPFHDLAVQFDSPDDNQGD